MIKVTFFQGSWLVSLGLILFPPFSDPWDQESIPQMKIVMIIFLWVIAANVFGAVLLGLLALCRVRHMTPPEVYDALEKSCGANVPGCEMDVEQCKYMLVYSDDDA